MASCASVAGGKPAALLVCFGLIVVAVSGCGSSGKLAPTPNSLSPTPASIPGNWEFTLTNTVPVADSSGMPMGAYLTSTGTAITGTAWVQIPFPNDCTPTCCGGPFAEFSPALTGTLSSSGALALASTVPNGGPVFTVTGTMTGTTMSGAFNLTGGCPAQGTITGVLIHALDGTYTGTLTSQDTGQTYTLTTSLEQSTTLNTRNFFDVSGTATLSNYPCLSTMTVPTPLANDSGFLGSEFSVDMAGSSAATLGLSGTLSQDGKSIAVNYSAVGGSCSNDFGTGTLTLQ